jgi:hypothetical protein
MRHVRLMSVLHPAPIFMSSISAVGASYGTSKETATLVVRHLLDTLEHKAHVLKIISGDDYIKQHEHLFRASVGGHMRHSLDHIRVAVAAAIDSSIELLDYDSRSRGTDIERDSTAALSAVEQIRRDLIEFDNIERKHEKVICVSFIGDSNTGASYSVPSSLHRELSFTAHHASHHLFLIRVMMERMGYMLDKNVGIANSTIMHANK